MHTNHVKADAARHGQQCSQAFTEVNCNVKYIFRCHLKKKKEFIPLNFIECMLLRLSVGIFPVFLLFCELINTDKYCLGSQSVYCIEVYCM